VCLQPLASWNCGLESRQGHGCLSHVSAVYGQIDVSATAWSLVQRSPTECAVSECVHEAWIMRTPWPTRGCCPINKNQIHFPLIIQTSGAYHFLANFFYSFSYLVFIISEYISSNSELGYLSPYSNTTTELTTEKSGSISKAGKRITLPRNFQVLGPSQLLIHGYGMLVPKRKEVRTWSWPSAPCSAEVKNTLNYLSLVLHIFTACTEA
jgi:hypothetical protein